MAHTTQLEGALALALQLAQVTDCAWSSVLSPLWNTRLRARRHARNTGGSTCCKCWIKWFHRLDGHRDR